MHTSIGSWLAHPWRALLLTLALIGIALIASTYIYARNRVAAIEYVENGYGYIAFAPRPGWIPDAIQVPEWPCSVNIVRIRIRDDRDVAEFVALRKLEMFICSGEITDRGLERVSELPRLRIASLNRRESRTPA